MRLINTILLLFILFFADAQSTGYLGKINLSVVKDEQTERLYPTQITKLESKIISAVSRYGISGQGYSSNFVITPRLEVYDEQLVEGMKNLYVITLELNLFIKQAKANIVYSTYNKQLKGTGASKNEAITNAISQLNANDPSFKVFIEEGQKKILAFYNSKCNDIILEADKYAGMNDYTRALAILMSVPTEATPCYEKIKNKSISIFKLYQKKECQAQLQIAKAQIAGQQYMLGLQTLTFIDPTSSCYTEAKTLMASVDSKITAEQKRQWEMQKEKMKNEMEMEKYEIDAIKGVVETVVGGLVSGANIWETMLGFLF